MRAFLKWLAASGIVVWGVSMLAGDLPPRLRLLVLFSVTFGLLAGWSARFLADGLGVPTTRWPTIVVFFLTVAGLVNQTYTSYRRLQASARARAADDPQQLLALPILKNAARDDPVLQRRYLEERTRLQPEFGDYLALRLANVAWLPPPWPAVIWTMETLLGGLAATLLYRRRSIEAPRQRPIEKSKVQSPKSKIEGSDGGDTFST